MHNLLSWVHPGFSVFAGPPVGAAASASLESQSRYITRPALAMDALEKLDDGNLALENATEPRTGATRVVLDTPGMDPPDHHACPRGSHCMRFYGAFFSRGRIICAGSQAGRATGGHPPPGKGDNSDLSREARSTWVRLIRKIFEAVPRT